MIHHGSFILYTYVTLLHLRSKKRETYNGSVLPHCTLFATLFATGSYEQCCTQLMKVLHKFCNTDMLGVLLIYPYFPSGAVRPWDHVYILVKPLAAMLQYIVYTSYTKTSHQIKCLHSEF